MTVPEIISNTLDKIRRDFYTVDGTVRTREFMRDYRPLMKAIATYGYECNQRGWNFEPDFIYHELMELLKQIRTAGADVQYLPSYLAGSIRRHLGQRAEELSAKAKSVPLNTAAILRNLEKAATVQAGVRQPTTVEVFAEVYKGIKKIQRQRKAGKAAPEKQPSFL